MSTEIIVVGAGVAGLAAARALRASLPAARITVLERSRRAGGLVETENTPTGLVVEHGADCLVTTKPQGLQTIRSLRLDAAVVPGPTKPSFIAAGDSLIPMPRGAFPPSWASAAPLLRSSLFSARGKARILLEPLVAPRRETEDESVASFVRRRFGDELLDRAIGPILSLIHGTPADRLSVRAALPRLAELERVHGSIASGLAKVREGAGPSAPATVTPTISFRRGMSTLTEAMARSLEGKIRFGVDVRTLERRRNGGYRLRTAEHGTIDAAGVVIAVPAHVAARLLDGVDADLASMLGAVAHGRLDAVTMAWPRAGIPHPMDGTGFVVADTSGRTITGCTWMTECWPDRAPEGIATLRSFAAEADASDEELALAIRRDLRDLMGIEAPPAVVHLRRRARVLPRYEIGCMDQIETMRRHAAALGALALAGNAHGGVGIPDCIRSGEAAAKGLVAELSLADAGSAASLAPAL